MKRIGLFLCLFMLWSQIASAQSVREIIQEGIFKRSPIGRFIEGDFSPGVKLFRDEARCVHEDLQRVFSMQTPPIIARFPARDEEVFDKTPNDRTRDLRIQIEEFEDQIVLELGAQLRVFEVAGDLVTDRREICVGSAQFESPNAISIGYGFLVFDPAIFFKIAQRENTNEWSMRSIIAHEFAHQLQIWHNDPTLRQEKNSRTFVRNKELQADCVAAGILQRQSRLFPETQRGPEAETNAAIVSAFILLGDFQIDHFEGHHGTSYERLLMAQIGIQKAQERANLGPVTSEHLLQFCSTYIDGMNLRFGDQIWPFGSRL